MGRIYYKELPLFHLYDSDLTGTHKLLMCPEDVTTDLAELKRKGYLQDK